MIRKVLHIGSWDAEFYFAPDGYDIDIILSRLYDFGADAKILKKALAMMEAGELNKGMTFANPLDHIALVLVGPTSNGEEFIDSLVHEVHHLAVFIATELGIDLESETPAYISGDSARDLARVICKLGCSHCSSD